MRDATEELLRKVDASRREANGLLETKAKVELGQYLTPSGIASYMASLLGGGRESVKLLDAGAGVGSLTAAAVASFVDRGTKRIQVVMYEVDPVLIERLDRTAELCKQFCISSGVELAYEIRELDFIGAVVDALGAAQFLDGGEKETFTHTILNPPYKKINSESSTRTRLRRLGVEASNIYVGFLAAASELLDESGELVAITPRSFCNGPYFRSFRKYFLKRLVITHIHIYESRSHAFREDEVLQENVIFKAVRETHKPNFVEVSSSADSNSNISIFRVPYSDVIQPNDNDYFIHVVPDETASRVLASMSCFTSSLKSLGLSVSTGRVVDFRAAEFLSNGPKEGAVPLIYPVHFGEVGVDWPKLGKKPNAICHTDETSSLLIPNENYILLKRFSAKEEKRRLVARTYEGGFFPYEYVGFENHLNYIHDHGHGVDLRIARGLTAFYNSSLVDAYFRLFSGHTQVNASDIERMPHPTREQLERIGSLTSPLQAQSEIDRLVQQNIGFIALPQAALGWDSV